MLWQYIIMMKVIQHGRFDHQTSDGGYLIAGGLATGLSNGYLLKMDLMRNRFMMAQFGMFQIWDQMKMMKGREPFATIQAGINASRRYCISICWNLCREYKW